jgi:hypothetical protein
MLKRCGANTHARGEEVQFERALVGIDRPTSLELNPVLVHNRRRPGYHMEHHLDMRTQLITQFEEKSTTQAYLVYVDGHLERQLNPDPHTTVYRFDKLEEEYRTRLL